MMRESCFEDCRQSFGSGITRLVRTHPVLPAEGARIRGSASEAPDRCIDAGFPPG